MGGKEGRTDLKNFKKIISNFVGVDFKKLLRAR